MLTQRLLDGNTFLRIINIIVSPVLDDKKREKVLQATFFNYPEACMVSKKQNFTLE